MPGKLLAIDPSLTCSGWALFEIDSGCPVLFDIIRPPGTKLPLSDRYNWLQGEVAALLSRLELGERDYLCCEGPAPLVKNPESALRVERVRGVFEAVGRMRSVTVVSRLNPRTVQTELLGLHGKQLKREVVKEMARGVVQRLFAAELAKDPEAPKLSQDVVDALLIGALAVSRVQLHQKSGIALDLLFQPKRNGRGGRERFAGWRVSNG